MNFKELTEQECGGANPLMRLGQQLTSDFTLRDEGASNFRDINFQPTEVKFLTFETVSFMLITIFVYLTSDIPHGHAAKGNARNG